MIDHGQVDDPVADEVARGNGVRGAGHGDGRALERAIAVAQEDGDLVQDESVTARSVRPSLLKSAATIEVAPLPVGKATCQGLLERAVAVARQDGHAVRAFVDDGHAEVAVAGEVTGREGGRVTADRVGGRFLEGAVALA